MRQLDTLVHADIIQVLVDIVFLTLAFAISYLIAGQLTGLYGIAEYLWILIVYAPIWIFFMALQKMYDQTTFYYFDRFLLRIVFSSLFSGSCTTAMIYFIKESAVSRLFVSTFIVCSVVVMLAERIAAVMIKRKGTRKNGKPKAVLVCTQETYTIFRLYTEKSSLTYDLVGFIPVDEGETIAQEVYLGQLADLEHIIKTNVVERVIFAAPRDRVGDLEQYVKLCEGMGVTVQLLLNLYDLSLAHVHVSMFGPIPMLTFHTVPLNPLQREAKRLTDIVVSIIGLVITFFAALIIVPAIKLDSPGPVLFTQKRVGRNGRVFNMYKFRTMCADAEEKKAQMLAQNEMNSNLMFKIEKDPRVTRVGNILRETSLDELPQFLNVLKGDMSIVGTRPPTVDEVAQYDHTHWRRISITPGMTGLWQVSGRSSIKDFAEIVALDTEYIDKWSLWLDVKIILKTISIVLKRKSAY